MAVAGEMDRVHAAHLLPSRPVVTEGSTGSSLVRMSCSSASLIHARRYRRSEHRATYPHAAEIKKSSSTFVIMNARLEHFLLALAAPLGRLAAWPLGRLAD